MNLFDSESRSSLIIIAVIFVSWLNACGPIITTVKPTKVDADGGAVVVIEGKNLDESDLYIDNEKVSTDEINNKSIVFTSPERKPGKAKIKVKNSDGEDEFDGFSFVKRPDMKYIIEFRIEEGRDAYRNNLTIMNNNKTLLLKNKYKIPEKYIVNIDNLPYAIVKDLTKEEILLLRNDPAVKEVHENIFRARQTEQSLPLIEQQQAYEWGATGEGYSIAILDTGADYEHDDLGACQSAGKNCRVKISLDFTPKDDGQLDADPNKHGTNVASIIAKTAPKADIISLDVFEPNGAADSDVIKALNWVISHRDEYNIVAVNMSLGSKQDHAVECKNTVYDSAFEWLLQDGIQVVVAAGNDSMKKGLSIPACHPLAISVGATTDAVTSAQQNTGCDNALSVDEVACFSNSAPTLDILAPGTNITAGGETLSGTSQAAPHVTGALAALKSKFPSRSSAELLLRLQQTGKNVTDPANGVRARRINLASAMNDPPVAVDDKAIAIEGGGVVIDVLANDDDEHREKMRVDGVVIPEGQGIYARVINNKIYFFADPSVTGRKEFRYSMKDEYGVLATAMVTVDIHPYSLPSPRIVTNEPSLLSKLAKLGDNPFIIYESGRFQERKIWFQQLETDGRLKGDRYSISGDDPEIQASYLDAKADDKGYTVAWIKKRSMDGKYVVQAANGNMTLLPTPYEASFYYNFDAHYPSVTLLDGSVIIGWEQGWDPGKRYAQAFGRNVQNPSPHGSLQEFPEWISFTRAYATVPINSDQYIHMRSSLGKDSISTRRIDRIGKYIWVDPKTIPDWRGSPPQFIQQINNFKVVPDDGGFALAWSHAQYAGRYSVSLQKFDADAVSRRNLPPVAVLPELNSMGDVSLIKFDDGSYRVIWNETHGDFAALVSASVSSTGEVGEKLIDYWTTDANAFAPYKIAAMPLIGKNYILSWSNNKRQLTSITRKQLNITNSADEKKRPAK